jgi:replicative DNA helicase
MGRIDSLIQDKFRSKDIEMEVAAYAILKDEKALRVLKWEWFSYKLIADILRVSIAIGVSVTRSSIMLKLAPDDDSRDLYDIAWNEITSVDVSRLDWKWFEHTLGSLVDLYNGRNFLGSVHSVIQDAKNGTFTMDKVRSIFRPILSAVPSASIFQTYSERFPDRLSVMEERIRMADEGVSGIPFGVKQFDQATGGLVKPEFGVLIGRSGVGKTAALLHVGISAAKAGYNVLFVSGEMPQIDIEFRIDSYLSRVSATKFRKGLLSQSDIDKWGHSVGMFEDETDALFVVESFPRHFSTESVERVAYAVQDRYAKKIDLILLDYINILSPVNAGKKTTDRGWESQADAVWDVKGMCSDFNGGEGVCLWTAGQLKDEALKAKELTLGDAKYSRAIGEAAPVVLGLIQSREDQFEGTMQLQVLKMRNAKKMDHMITLHSAMDFMIIHETPLGGRSLFEGVD